MFKTETNIYTIYTNIIYSGIYGIYLFQCPIVSLFQESVGKWWFSIFKALEFDQDDSLPPHFSLMRYSKGNHLNLAVIFLAKFCVYFGILLNGLTNFVHPGEFIFTSARCCCLIHYILLRFSFRIRVVDFSVGSRISSDHFPLILTVKYRFSWDLFPLSLPLDDDSDFLLRI